MNRKRFIKALAYAALCVVVGSGCLTKMGRSVRDDVDVKVNSVVEASSLQASSSSDTVQPSTGKIFLICNVTVNNKRSSSFTFYPFHVLMTTSPGSTDYYRGYAAYNGQTSFTNCQPILTTIAAGTSATGDVVYEVAPGTRPREFRMGYSQDMPHEDTTGK